jgi:hypothetical protein
MNRPDTRQLDFNALRTALEQRNANLATSFYADDAEIDVVDRLHPPASPLRVRGKQAIADFYADICSRDVTHQVENALVDENHAAFTEDCKYADGKRVLCANFLNTQDGVIVRQTEVLAWDE